MTEIGIGFLQCQVLMVGLTMITKIEFFPVQYFSLIMPPPEPENFFFSVYFTEPLLCLKHPSHKNGYC